MMCTQALTFKVALGAIAFSFALAGCPKDEPPDPPPSSTGPNITAFTANPTSVARGGTVTLSWTVERANSITIVAMPGGTLVDASTSLMGSMESAAIDANTTFQLTATGADGKTDMDTVMVTIDSTLLSISSFEAMPNPARRGGTTELRWRTTGATNVVIKEGANTIFTAPANQRDNGSTLSPALMNATHTFTIEASNATEMRTQMVTVNAEVAPEIMAFTADPTSFNGASQVVTLSWTASNVTSLRLNQNGSPSPGFNPANLNMGTTMVTITDTTVFELVASSGGGEARANATVAKTIPETEPNGTYMEATPLTTGAAAGEMTTVDDVDFYSFTVGAEGNVFASVKNADGSCPFVAFLTLHGPDGAEIGTAFPALDGSDDCPAIDPREQGFPSGLEAGTYYVSVNSLDGTGPYTLVVIVGAPGCGNGIFETGELCDDGNTTNGDNCNSQCQFEIVATINPPGGSAIVNLAPFVSGTSGYYRWIEIRTTMSNQSIEVETSGEGGGCPVGMDTYLALIDATDFYGESYDDGAGGDCAHIRFPQDSFAVGLPRGTYYLFVVNESIDAAATINVNVTIHDPGCGNTAVEPGEQCDDGNMTGGDGCSANCSIEPLGMVMGPPGDQIFSGALDPGTQQDFYAITLNQPGYVFAQTFAPMEPTCTPTTTDTILALLDNAFMEVAGNDDSNGNRCSTIRPNETTLLMPGNYYLRVTSYPGANGPEVIPAYQVRIRVLAVGCGNAIIEMGEQCDDGNTAPGDGCTAMCGVEPLGTIMGPPGNQTFDNELDPITEIDYYRVILTAPGYIEVQTGAPMFSTCTPTVTDTLARVLADDFTEISRNDDIDFFNDNRCSHIRPAAADLLAAGSYWVSVSGFGLSPIPDYAVRIRLLIQGCGNNISEMGETCDDGNTTSGDGCSATCQFEGMVTNESEPNNDIMTADASTAGRGRTVIVGGSISPIGDVDVYSVTLTGAPSTISARTHTIPGDPTACNSSFDTYIYLKDAMGNDITDDDDINYPTNPCSFIDGATDTLAQNLAAGTYYIEVHHFDDTEELMNYYMSITIQ